MLQIQNLSKRYANKPALHNFSIEVPMRQIVAILGPSGCGKSTLLHLIAGLQTPDAGQILWQKQNLSQLPIHKRPIGLMFQDYALFPHLDVSSNVGYGLRWQSLAKSEKKARVQALLHMMGLAGYEKRAITSLSGGEQQRVALARTLANTPPLLLLDEPLSALDRSLRDELLPELVKWLSQQESTVLFVTHDHAEAFTLAERVILLRAGAIQQDDTPQNVYQNPANPFVAEFLGQTNLFPGTIESHNGQIGVRLPFGWLACPSVRAFSTGQAVTVLIKAHRIELTTAGAWHLLVEKVNFAGTFQHIIGKLQDGSILQLQLPAHVTLSPTLPIHIPSEALCVWDERYTQFG
ncbi:MAG TPA: ABC transporter ATP-binding protein [Anaerolineales bacterium]|nr:ABC transporter ATP-binding protein [Anaerolineales bacterium]